MVVSVSLYEHVKYTSVGGMGLADSTPPLSSLCTCPVEQCPTEYFHEPTRVLRGISGVLRPMHRLATADSSAMMLICVCVWGGG